MAVMRVGKMRVSMLDRFVTVSMGVLLAGRQDNTWLIRVLVLMVLVVRMFMLVILGLVDVGMFVPLRQVQPNAQAHQ